MLKLVNLKRAAPKHHQHLLREKSKLPEIKVTIEYTTLEDGSRWCRIGDVFKNEWFEWEKLS